jgi:hypothetical protein
MSVDHDDLVVRDAGWMIDPDGDAGMGYECRT